MISLLVTDDHPVVRQGIIQMLSDCTDVKNIDEASDGKECLKKIGENSYDVLLLDISMSGRDGLEILKEVKAIKPKLPVLMLSIYPEKFYAVRALKNGAAGYLTKSSEAEELVGAIRTVAGGNRYISASVADSLVTNIEKETNKPLHLLLSDRELEVMCLLAEGNKLKKIAELLSLSTQTISTYRERIISKMSLNTTAEIIRYAIKEGLVK